MRHVSWADAFKDITESSTATLEEEECYPVKQFFREPRAQSCPDLPSSPRSQQEGGEAESEGEGADDYRPRQPDFKMNPLLRSFAWSQDSIEQGRVRWSTLAATSSEEETLTSGASPLDGVPPPPPSDRYHRAESLLVAEERKEREAAAADAVADNKSEKPVAGSGHNKTQSPTSTWVYWEEKVAGAVSHF